MAVIHRVRIGTCNTYLIRGDSGYILVDAGNSNREKVFLYYLKKRGISPEKIKLIIVTHVHYDHVGSLGAIKKTCQCPAAVHNREAKLLEEGKFIMPPGTNLLGKTVAFLGKKVAWTGFFNYEPVKPEIVVGREMALEDFGVAGSIVPTPGHTEGSISVVLPTGEAFVGDLAVNFLGSVFPPFAHNVRELLMSWRKLADMGAHTIFPGHGPPFSVNLLKKKQGLQVKSLRPGSQLT
jgi:glyoxylase-like metal-dependent hydrolase (beta-lactamase superfamily II)